MKKFILLSCLMVCAFFVIAQKDIDGGKPVYDYTPLTLKVTEDGSKYVRFIMWQQLWVTTNNLAIDDAKFQANASIRRSRFLAYAQISPRFLILTHWGLNGLNANNMTSLGGNGDAPQLFLHGAWGEIMLDKSVYVGAGLHYWRGLTRLSNQSTLNFMTMDQSRPFVQWHSLGVTDQFARHMGVYFKGDIGKLDYRLAINNPIRNNLGGGLDYGGMSDLTYNGVLNQDSNGDPVGNAIVEGYFRYSVWDKESTKLPYIVGTYLGKKRVLAIGAGFFAHPNGMYNATTAEHENVTHVAGDVFLDLPVGDGNGFNAYASFINFNYGENYMARWAGTGTNIYGQAGYYLGGAKLMPYVAFQSGSYDAFDDNLTAFDVGVNYHLNGHNAKVTLEYHTISNNPLEGGVDADGIPNGTQQLRLQLHVFL